MVGERYGGPEGVILLTSATLDFRSSHKVRQLWVNQLLEACDCDAQPSFLSNYQSYWTLKSQVLFVYHVPGPIDKTPRLYIWYYIYLQSLATSQIPPIEKHSTPKRVRSSKCLDLSWPKFLLICLLSFIITWNNRILTSKWAKFAIFVRSLRVNWDPKRVDSRSQHNFWPRQTTTLNCILGLQGLYLQRPRGGWWITKDRRVSE
jgi:hypothetical protein